MGSRRAAGWWVGEGLCLRCVVMAEHFCLLLTYLQVLDGVVLHYAATLRKYRELLQRLWDRCWVLRSRSSLAPRLHRPEWSHLLQCPPLLLHLDLLQAPSLFFTVLSWLVCLLVMPVIRAVEVTLSWPLSVEYEDCSEAPVCGLLKVDALPPFQVHHAPWLRFARCQTSFDDPQGDLKGSLSRTDCGLSQVQDQAHLVVTASSNFACCMLLVEKKVMLHGALV